MWALMCMHIAKSENGLCIPSKSLNSVHSLDAIVHRRVNPGKVKKKMRFPFDLFFENSVKPTIVVKYLL